MRYAIPIQMVVEARSDEEALAWARIVEKLVKNSFVKSSIEAEGVRVVGDAVVFVPQRQL
jgi:hypothetical protein